jgi:hypothetical protein
MLALALSASLAAGCQQRTGTEAPAAGASGAVPAGIRAGVGLPTGPLASPHRSSGAPQEGVQVHGDWTIEIRDPDGDLVGRHEFRNSFVGAPVLARTLARKLSLGLWRILVNAPGAVCAGGVVYCSITESGSVEPGPVSKTLTIDAPSQGANANKLVLKGTFIAASNTSLTNVLTEVWECPSITPPASPCNMTGSANSFTTKALNPAIPVVEGQQVLVTVVISFS